MAKPTFVQLACYKSTQCERQAIREAKGMRMLEREKWVEDSDEETGREGRKRELESARYTSWCVKSDVMRVT